MDFVFGFHGSLGSQARPASIMNATTDAIMAAVSHKQRFLDTLLGGGSDRFPFFDLEPAEDTLARWHREGLPPGKSVAAFFNLEEHCSVGLTVRSAPFFRMAPDLLHDPISFTRHYNPDDSSRYAPNFVQRGRRLNRKGRVVYVDAWGGGLLQMLGVGDWNSLISACHALIWRPRRVEDLIERTTNFYCVCLERVLSRVPVDYASFYEPIASNTGPVISPAMFERFALPGYRKVLNLLKEFRVPLRILCTTGGNLNPLFPPLIDAGINGLWISNIRSSNQEYDKLRRNLGANLALIGGIDCALLTLKEAAMRRALEKTVLPLLEIGRYLPCLDDRPRLGVPFSKYRLFRALLQEIALKG